MVSRRLVTQYLEGASYELLEAYQSVFNALVGARSGIYALYRRERLYYVGLASSLKSRLKAHLKDRHKDRWETFSLYLTVNDEHMKELESLLLRIADPVGNRVKGRFRKATDLHRELSRRMREADETARAQLLRGKYADSLRRRRASRSTGDEALQGLFDKPTTLVAFTRKGKIKATLRTNGSIRVGRRIFTSASSAAKAFGGTRNGWSFWKYKDRKSGAWQPLGKRRG